MEIASYLQGSAETASDNHAPQSKRKIILNAFLQNTPNHLAPGLWRHPESSASKINSLSYWTDLIQELETAKFHAVFLADVAGVYDVYNKSKDAAVRSASQFPDNDPLYLVPAMAAVTKSIGFAITSSTTYDHPYGLARRHSTVDHLSEGRLGWNVVTSYLESGAQNHGLDTQLPHDERYAVAEEYMDIVYKLWEASWRDDAVKLDVESNTYTDPSLVRYINHKGKYFPSVPGPHIAQPSKQRTPVIFQAGMSSAGRKFAAKHAEGIFITGNSPQSTRKTADEMRKLSQEFGRSPDSVKLFALVFICVDETQELAEAKYEELKKYVDLEGALVLFGGWFGLDVSVYDDDQDLRKVTDNKVLAGALTAWANTSRIGPDVLWNKWRVAEEFAFGGRGDVIVGDPKTVCDRLESWVDDGNVDGFNLVHAIVPGTYRDVAKWVIPELQKRGRFWNDYDYPGGTLRENLFGRAHVADDHPAGKYKWKADSEFPLSTNGHEDNSSDSNGKSNEKGSASKKRKTE